MKLRAIHIMLPLVIAAVTVAAFWPVVDNGFVDWGDETEILANEEHLNFTPANLLWMFTTIQMGHYQPLTWLTFAVDHQLWGMAPAGYHLNSLLLHAACAAAAWFLIRRLLRLAFGFSETNEPRAAMWCAAAGTLLFALHPLRVESVAWAVERRGVLSAFFVLLAVIFYLRFAQKAIEGNPASSAPRPSRGLREMRHDVMFSRDPSYWVAVLMFALALLAKELSLTLPAILLVLDAYPLRRLNRNMRSLLVEKWPFLALSTVWVVIAAISSVQSGVARSLTEHDLLQRAAQALYGLAFYPARTLIPTSLSNLYSISPVMNPFETRIIIGAMAVIAITIILVLVRRRFPAGLAVWICFVILVSPVLGFFQTGHQLVADRYSYLPAVALSAAISGLLLRACQSRGEAGAALARRAAISAASLAILAGLSLMSRRQIEVWRDSQTLWAHAVDVEPRSPIAHNNLGAVLAREGRHDEAIAHFQWAVELDGDYAAARENLREMLSRAETN